MKPGNKVKQNQFKNDIFLWKMQKKFLLKLCQHLISCLDYKLSGYRNIFNRCIMEIPWAIISTIL